MKHWSVILLAVLASGCSSTSSADEFPDLTGDYFGQPVPGDEAELFAPGLICTALMTRDVAMTPDGSEIYYCVATNGFGAAAIMETRLVDGRWTRPEVAAFSSTPGSMNFEPCISPDGQRLFFLSDRPNGDGEAGNSDIWVMDREGDQWGAPRNLGAPINTPEQEYFPSVTRDGTLYFTRADPETREHNIYRSRLVNGAYSEPELLPEQINCGRARFNAFVAPDESFVIVPAAGMPDTHGGVDYYITFRDAEDQWTEPLNMGEPVNSENGNEWSASLSPDGEYLFFMSARVPEDDESQPLTIARIQEMQDRPQNGTANIFWMRAAVIDELREAAYRGD